MDLPINAFKRALRAKRSQIGLWCTLGSPTAAEAVAGSGFDWLLIDTEHTPVSIEAVLAQLQACAACPVAPVVRPSWNDPVEIKRLLDIGAQTLLIPYVQTAAEARLAVSSMRYPPEGIRGVAGTTRATRYGRVQGYTVRASEELCLLVQVETRDALAALDDIAAVDGVDGVFIGPSDLSASMGHPGNPGHPEVVAAIENAIERILAAGKAPGILTLDEAFARRCIERGMLFTAVGVDAVVLVRETESLARRFKKD
jgi:4-hydroxy-2-oxoheptanedioate aldolase